MKKILVTGAAGQIGSELVPLLRRQFGAENIVAAIHKSPGNQQLQQEGPVCHLDVRDRPAVLDIVKQYKVDAIFHLASLLSAVAERQPQLAWDVNNNGLFNVLEVARINRCAVFFPSSIGAFGPSSPKFNTPQDTIQRPSSLYGITKVTGELLCDYYYQRYAVDARGLRFPGLISYQTPPGGGTTDYAVEIFYAALQKQHYNCFLRPDTELDMMYMPDAIAAAVKLMTAAGEKLQHRNAYNVTTMSITPLQLATEISRHLPNFTIAYKVDPVRQKIADSWPRHMDDSAARQEWGWRPRYDLKMMVGDMLEKLAVKLAKTRE